MKERTLSAQATVELPNKTVSAPKLVRQRSDDKLTAQQAQAVERRRQGAIFMAALGVVLLLHRRANYDSWLVMAIESSASLLCLLLAAKIQQQQSSAEHGVALRAWVGGFACLAVAMPWIANLFAKQIGLGNGMEIVMLISLAWAAVALAWLAKVTRTISLSVVCSGFLTLFATFISDSSSAIWLSAVWGFACLWWLTNNHWEQIETTAAVGIQPARVQRTVITLVGCAVFCLGALAVSNRVPVWRKLEAELMPTSGGTSAKDSAARRGVGNGDALVAAKKHATSFGAVETDLFLDSEKPSLFDVFSDEFGEPQRTTRVERAQALSPRDIQSEEGNFTEANRSASGSEFSIERELPEQHKPTDNLVAESLMFWQGEAGAHLAAQRFDSFDGHGWFHEPKTEMPAKEPKLVRTLIDEQSWFSAAGRSLQNSISPFVDALPEAIKFTRYRSPIIPTRLGMQLWCIDLIDREDFFEVSANDCLSMSGREHVPDYTVVRMINSRIDLERLESLTRTCSPGRTHRQLTEGCESLINQLSHKYAGDLPRGWQQVQAVVSGLRNEFELDRFALGAGSLSRSQSDADESAVAESATASRLVRFLELRRGPDYLFATAAALMLEHLGYDTRFVTGFYANPKNYMPLEGEMAILPGDAHAWLEINVGHGYWIPLEPSPGYRQPRYTASLWYRMQQYRSEIAGSAAGCLTLLVVGYLLRSWLVEMLSLCFWPLVSLMGDRGRIVWLSRLLDLRCRMAGVPRSASTVPRAHLMGLMPGISGGLQHHIAQFLDSADRMWFFKASRLTSSEHLAIASVWHQLTISTLRRGKGKLA